MKARPQPLAATLTVAAKTLAEVEKLGHTLKLDSALVEHAVLARWRDPDGYWPGPGVVQARDELRP
jgi:hypothetical protein